MAVSGCKKRICTVPPESFTRLYLVVRASGTLDALAAPSHQTGALCGLLQKGRVFHAARIKRAFWQNGG